MHGRPYQKHKRNSMAKARVGAHSRSEACPIVVVQCLSATASSLAKSSKTTRGYEDGVRSIIVIWISAYDLPSPSIALALFIHDPGSPGRRCSHRSRPKLKLYRDKSCSCISRHTVYRSEGITVVWCFSGLVSWERS